MNVANSVRKAIDDWEQREFDAAMLHACNAIDGTARKLYPGLGNKARFYALPARELCNTWADGCTGN